MRYLLIKPSSFGDVLHAIPAVEYLHSAQPEAEIDWLVNDTFADAVRLSPFVSRIIPFSRNHPFSPTRLHRLLQELRKEKYDAVLDLQGLLRSGIFSFLAKSKRRIGFRTAREGAPLFYTDRIDVRPHSHAVEKNLELVRQAFQPATPPPTQTNLRLPPEAMQAAEELLSPAPSAPWLSVCFSSRWSSKNWSAEFLIQVLQRLSRRLPDLRIAMVGSATDVPLGDHLARSLPNAQNLAGKTTLPVLAALLSKMKAMFTVDSGPMHLAAAVHTRCLAMFGSTDSVLTGPWGPDGFHKILASPCQCSPCFQRVCPRGDDCSRNVSVDSTVQQLQELL